MQVQYSGVTEGAGRWNFYTGNCVCGAPCLRAWYLLPSPTSLLPYKDSQSSQPHARRCLLFTLRTLKLMIRVHRFQFRASRELLLLVSHGNDSEHQCTSEVSSGLCSTGHYEKHSVREGTSELGCGKHDHMLTTAATFGKDPLQQAYRHDTVCSA